eukprot:7284821-Prymnesium_polylepis.1
MSSGSIAPTGDPPSSVQAEAASARAPTCAEHSPRPPFVQAGQSAYRVRLPQRQSLAAGLPLAA